NEDWRAAGHALQQHIGPAFVGRNEHKEVGSAVDLGEAILRHAAEQADSVGNVALARYLLYRTTFGALAHDHELESRQLGQRFDHQLMAFEGDKVAHGEKRRTRETEASPRRRAIVWPKQRKVHPIAQHTNPLSCDSEFDEALLQPARHGDQAVRM